MLRRNIWSFVTVPCIALAFAGLNAAVAQDKPAEKPAEKPKAEKPAQHKEEKHEAAKAEKDIVETAMANKDFSTLCDLLKAADLVDTLKGPGPFTVFAPTNAAFDKLGKETLDNLKKDKAKLAGILKYHVANGKMMASDVTKAKTIKTVNGAELAVSEKNGKWMVDKSTITSTDIKCKNGVIHVIDAVAMPAEKPAK